MIDYSEFPSAIGLNWYDIDPNLQFLMSRLLAPADFEWLEPELREIGALCGGPVAARAEVTDKHPPELVKFDYWGDPLDEVRHHPGALASKRDLWEAGVSGPRLHDEARRRGRQLPETVPIALNYMLSQAEIGMLCSTGMTSGVIDVVRRFAPPEVQREFVETHLRRHPMRGLLSDDRSILDLFDPIVCYGEIDDRVAAVALRGA